MNNIKICERCKTALISNLDSENCDYYRHIRIKYCDKCRVIVNREKTLERVKRYNARKKKIISAEDTRLEILTRENLEMYNNYIEICEAVEKLKKEIKVMRGDVKDIGRQNLYHKKHS